MQYIIRIGRIPAFLRIPSLIGDINPFRFGRQTVAVHIFMERKANQIVAISRLVKRSILVRINGIQIFGLALGICIKHRIKERHVSHRGIITTRVVALTSKFFTQRIILATSHLMFADVKIIGERDIHFWSFAIAHALFVGSQIRRFVMRSDIDKTI